MTEPKVVNITRHIYEEQRKYPLATGGFSGLLSDLMLACKMISREVNKAGLIDILGKTGEVNVQGEEVAKLDTYAHNRIHQAMDHGGHLCVMASEEVADPIPIPKEFSKGRYVLLFDPLDGSSNIDSNVGIGTIFSIHRKVSDAGPDGTMQDLLQTGTRQVCAGYVFYGASTVFVYTTGQGTAAFTLDPSVGEFLLSSPHIQIPRRGRIYSVNEGNAASWDDATKRYIEHIKQFDPETNRPYTLRYVGSLVADIHRTLLYGGIFLYPPDRKSPKGKLRLLYEAAPMAFLVEQAGGFASNGTRRIMEVEPSELHQRTPLIIGSPDDVRDYEAYALGRR
ncbi:MAG: class 1 fructose-bisphosphatase [Candidatus Riflebacteria bacterium]|nr:class 1 fructose-bisphosphatase [Candidatus Riflebacteria bacterium]